MRLYTLLKTLSTIVGLKERGVIDKEESYALMHFSLFGDNPGYLETLRNSDTNIKEHRRAIARIIYQPGFLEELDRKLTEHIIPFAKKASLCYLLRK